MTDKMLTSWLVLGMMIAAICVNLGFIYYFRRRHEKMTALQEGGMEAQATVTSRLPLRSSQTRYLEVKYRFPSATSGEAAGKNNLSALEKETVYAAGTVHAVVYLSDSPSVSALKAELPAQVQSSGKASRLMTFALLMPAPMYVVMWFLLAQQNIVAWPF